MSALLEKTGAYKRGSDPGESRRAPSNERRKGRRRAMRLPLFVYGCTERGKPFVEFVEWAGASENGALLILSTRVAVGQDLVLVNRDTGAEFECTVVRLGRVGFKTPVGVRFRKPSPEFWRMSASNPAAAAAADAAAVFNGLGRAIANPAEPPKPRRKPRFDWVRAIRDYLTTSKA